MTRRDFIDWLHSLEKLARRLQFAILAKKANYW